MRLEDLIKDTGIQVLFVTVCLFGFRLPLGSVWRLLPVDGSVAHSAICRAPRREFWRLLTAISNQYGMLI